QAFAKGFDQVEDVIRRRRGNPQRALDLTTVTQEKLDVRFLLQQRLDHRQQARTFVADGEAAATACMRFDTDPARTLCVDLLTDLSRHRTLM
ncbi:hypothetical protein, partial [Klebsiella pneumoniae]|uniref:hypothetical protein n=1 Tax=Klebsiella pneumoniae TaxID=573 RepID=UPI0027306004